MPNIKAMPQATGERQTLPVVGGGASSGASSEAETAWSWICARGESLRLSTHSNASQGRVAMSAKTPHEPSDTRQPAATANGTAINAGRMVPNCSTVMYKVLTVPTRSAK